jgi:hypothetical protein
MAETEFTSRELDLLAGYEWAKSAEQDELRLAADEQIVPQSARDALTASGLADDERITPGQGAFDFLQGFIRGVRAFLVEDLDRLSTLN